LSSRITDKFPKRIRKAASSRTSERSDTKLESFELFKSGKSIPEIAVVRSLSTSTIENHLAHYIDTGEIGINELVTKEKIELIEKAIQLHGHLLLSNLKNALGETISYGEIRAVINHLKLDFH